MTPSKKKKKTKQKTQIHSGLDVQDLTDTTQNFKHFGKPKTNQKPFSVPSSQSQHSRCTAVKSDCGTEAASGAVTSNLLLLARAILVPSRCALQ